MVLSPFSTRRICSRDAKRKQEFSNVIGWRKSSLLRQPITLLNSCFRFASREQIRLVENGLYLGAQVAQAVSALCLSPLKPNVVIVFTRLSHMKHNDLSHRRPKNVWKFHMSLLCFEFFLQKINYEQNNFL